LALLHAIPRVSRRCIRFHGILAPGIQRDQREIGAKVELFEAMGKLKMLSLRKSHKNAALSEKANGEKFTLYKKTAAISFPNRLWGTSGSLIQNRS
jgi:hypothetical protein